MPEITVVMPVYNTKEEYFREAIESILNQTFEDFEFLIIDNGSESYIGDIIKSYKDKRIKSFMVDNNEGPAYARNLGIEHAQAKYIAFMDADDVSYPERLERQHEYMENHQEIGCLGSKEKVIGSLADKLCFPNVNQHKDIELWLLFKGCVFCQSSVMLRKDILEKNYVRYNSYYVPTEDYALWLDLVGLTKFAVLDDILVDYRFYQENISNQKKKLQYQRGNEAKINALQKYLNIKGLDVSILNKFLLDEDLSTEEIKHINFIIPSIEQKLLEKGYQSEDICTLFQNHFRKLFYHTRTISGQWQLLTSPLNSYFGMKSYWRIFYFIFRGFLSVNKRRSI